MLDPAARFSSAGDVCRVLRGQKPRWHPSRRTAMAALTGGLSVTAMSLGVWFYRFPSRRHLKEGQRIVVTPVRNETGEPMFDGLSELMRIQIGQSAGLHVLGHDQLRRGVEQLRDRQLNANSQPVAPEMWREVAWRLGAGVLVFATLARVGVGYGLTVEYEFRGSSPSRPSDNGMRSFPVKSDRDLMAMAAEAASWLRVEVGEPTETVMRFDRPPEDVTTPFWEALSYYSRAENEISDFRYPEALSLLDSALERDPQFTLAATRKGDLLMSLQRHAEGLRQWQTAIGMLAKRGVTRREELYVRGMYSYDTGDMPGAAKHFKAWAVEFPGDWRGFFYQTTPQIFDGHAADAVRNLLRVAELAPEYNRTWAQLADCYIALGQWEEVEKAVARLERMGEKPYALLKRAASAFAQGKTEAALEILRELRQRPHNFWGIRASMCEALVLVESGEDDKALSLDVASVDSQTPAQGDTFRAWFRVVQGFAAYRAGDSKRAAALANQALELERGPYALAEAGTLLARTRHTDAAKRLALDAQQFGDMPLYKRAYHRIRGETAWVSGDVGQAIRELRSADATEPRLALRTPLARVLALRPDSTEEAEALHKAAAGLKWLVLQDPMRVQPGSFVDALRATNA